MAVPAILNSNCDLNASEDPKFGLQPVHFIGLIAAMLALHATGQYSYLLFHTLVEIVRITVLAGIFIVAWLSRRWLDKPFIVMIGVSSIFVALVELLHTLAYKGINVFVGYDANLPTQLWIAYRYLEALSLILAVAWPRRRIAFKGLIAAYAAVTAVLLASVFGGIFPDCFIEGQGLTPFKVNSEYAIIALFAIGAVGMYRRREDFQQPFVQMVVASLLIGMLAEFAFTRYVSVFGLANELGHYFLFVSSVMLYHAFVVTGVARPIDLLFDDLRQKELTLERRVSERTEELAVQQRRLHDILEGTNVGTWEWNVQTGETIFNDRWAELLGYSLEELSPVNIETWIALAHPDDLQKSDALLKKHFAGELRYYECEARMRHKDGHWIWVLDRGRVSSWTADGRPLLMSGTHQDITRRKLAERELDEHRNRLEHWVAARTADLEVAKEAAEAASRAKTTFLSIASHELRTPMHGVMGMVALAKRRTADPKALDYLNKAEGASNQLLGIINDVLDFSQIEADRLTLASTPFTIGEVLDRLKNTVEALVASKGLQLAIHIADRVAAETYLGDPTRLAQILINLVGNAIKFTARGSVGVFIREEHPKNGAPMLVFEVHDTGIGIRSEDLKRIFEPFNQADGSVTRKYGGTGLGLALCERLVHAMRGKIGVESKPGEGSRFWFRIPARQEQPPEEVASVDPAAACEARLESDHPGATILLVEDDPTNREILGTLLESVGLAVCFAEDGLQAIDRARTTGFKLILMDVKMPNMGGIEAAREIRKLPAHVRTPIVAVTANAFNDDRDECFRAGMNDHLGKPITPATLYATVLRWLDRP